MKAEIKYIHSPDVEDLTSWSPRTPNFSVLVQVVVGPEGSDGEESFDVVFCTPGWLAQKAQDTGIVDGRHMYVVSSWNWPIIQQYLDQRVTEIIADDWDGLATLLGRFGKWEFEDYNKD